MSITAIFVIYETWKQPQSSLTGYTIYVIPILWNYYSVIKINEPLIYAMTGITLDNTMLSKTNQRGEIVSVRLHAYKIIKKTKVVYSDRIQISVCLGKGGRGWEGAEARGCRGAGENFWEWWICLLFWLWWWFDIYMSKLIKSYNNF